VLQAREQARPECETELIDGDDETDNAGEMLLREFVLNDNAGQRRRIADAYPTRMQPR
jgi:hypothetical protein